MRLNHSKDGDVMYIFLSRPFWLELNIPMRTVKDVYAEYFGTDECSIVDRKDAITMLSGIVDKLQYKMVQRLQTHNISEDIKNLYKILDECYRFYYKQKEARSELVSLNISGNEIADVFETNRNIARNSIEAVNLWLENCLLYQDNIEVPYDTQIFDMDATLFVEMYVYGFASQSLSLLAMSKKFDKKEFYYGIKITPNDDIPAELLKYHPVIYFNTLMTGNQNSLSTGADLKTADEVDFGQGFFDEYCVSFINGLRIMSSFEKYMLNDGKYAMTVIDKSQFLAKIDRYSGGCVNAEAFFQTYVLTKDIIASQKRSGDPIIWIMNTNKYRHELRPFLCLENDRVVISYCALEQAKHLWTSIFCNGGMSYSNAKDRLTAAIERKNTDLSKQLVCLLRDKLNKHYASSFDEIDVRYDRIFGPKPDDYGDYDLVFYSAATNELFLIEAKFFSDSLNSSGVISDYDKMFKRNGYYDHCRHRYDLVLQEPEKMKAFISAIGQLNVHFLFVSSKPLEIEFEDNDGMVCFPCLSIFDKYLEGKLLPEVGDVPVRPTHLI